MGENKVDALYVAKNLFIPAKPAGKSGKSEIKINFKFPENKAETPQKPKEFNTIRAMVAKHIPDVSDEFITQILETSKKVKCAPEDLTALIYKESKFKPSAKNGKYRGLGQMTAASLRLSKQYAKYNPEEKEGIDQNMTFEKFSKLTREEQMPYVKNYILTMKEAYVKDMECPLDTAKLNGLFVSPANVMKPFAKKFANVLNKIKEEDLKITHTDLKA